ncbi:hypothetical protein NAP1_02505 [Erythrobacter sp. NAP1]|uniref:helix-turn-helix domain-containing protein n=1 Tax=Erythrobacter sp. NAP1 TaxID=237727 RepID=UPI0000686A3C|nr:helix-turn-helix domain-containing protein [Erythrobacter sp. NAP1]EAQ29607.1 hypothetical protein NAP1_02505 [Erythrobacter sp. NAP1]
MEFGNILARLRRDRGWSQEELAMRADLSQRHISFLETGRSKPGQSALAKLAKAMALRAWEQRALFRPLAGGRTELSAPEHTASLPQGFFERLSPWPACTFEPDGTLVQSNAALDTLLTYAGGGEDLWQATAADGKANMYDLVFHPDGLIRWMENPEEVIPETLRRLRIEASHFPSLSATIARFESYPAVAKWTARLSDPPSVLEERYTLRGETLRVISVLSSIASPGEFGLAALRIEAFVPADDQSAALISSIAPPATLPAT